MTTIPENVPFFKKLRDSYENRTKGVKVWLTSRVLSPEQQVHSFNSTPIFMILAICFQFYQNFEIVKINNQFLGYWNLFTLHFVSRLVIHIFIGIPLEIAHGTLAILVFYIVAMAYPQCVTSMVLDHHAYSFKDSSEYAIVGLHFANLVRNWKTFPKVYIHAIIMLLLIVPLEYHDFQRTSPGPGDAFWRVTLFKQTSAFAGFMVGILLGFFWIYRNKGEDKAETKWKNYAIILVTLTVYLVAMEMSGLHITIKEYFRELRNRKWN